MFSFSFISSILLLLSYTASAEELGRKNSTRYPLKQSDYNPVISKLDSVLERITLPSFLDKANVSADEGNGALAKTRWFIDSFNFTAEDGSWSSEGISSSTDAGNPELLKGEKDVLVVSWQDSAVDSPLGVRVTFIRRGMAYRPNQQRLYEHALLVEPFDDEGTPNFRPLSGIKSGGLVWRANWLYVTDEKEGLRVFDLDHIYSVSQGAHVGFSEKKYYGGGHKYVIPQARNYEPMISSGSSLVMHSASLDRNSTYPSIIVGESTNGNSTFCKYPLDEKTNLLVTNSTGYALPHWSWLTNAWYIQGLVYAKDGFFMVRSETLSENVDTSIGSEMMFWVPKSWADRFRGLLPFGTQGITFQPETDALWVVGGEGPKTFVMSLNSNRENVLPELMIKQMEASQDPSKGESDIAEETRDSLPPPNINENLSDSEQSKTLSTAQYVGIAIGIIIFAAIVACLFFLRRRSGTAGSQSDVETRLPPSPTNSSSRTVSLNSDNYSFTKAELDGVVVSELEHPHPLITRMNTHLSQSSGISDISRRVSPLSPTRSSTMDTFELPSPIIPEIIRYELPTEREK